MLIYHLNRTQPYFEVVEELLMAVRDGLKVAFVSVVTELELLVQPIQRERPWEIERIKAVLEAPQIQVIEMDRNIAQRAAEIRAHRHLALADATIIATGIVAGCDAVVGNDERCAQRVREIPYVHLDALVKELQS
ncbi:MAG: PIN domain-containing protein [Chloroflexi bacterium]|nr:PIN domain-containing protein [Chloroflexota bacterium]